MSSASLIVHNNQLMRLLEQIELLEKQIVAGDSINDLELDLTSYGSARPQTMAALTAYLEQLTHNYPSLNVNLQFPKNSDVLNYMTRMKFFEMNRFKVNYPYQEHDASGRFIELKSFGKHNQDRLNEEIASILKKMGIHDNMQRAIAFIFGEIIDNTCCHSESSFEGKICAQKFFNYVEIAIVDKGIGIADSLRTAEEHKGLSRKEALEQSINKGVSSKLNLGGEHRAHQGNGLHDVSKIVKMNGGSFSIYTGNLCLTTNQGGTYITESAKWDGTIIHIRLENSYPLKWQEIWNELFDGDEPYLNHLDDDDMIKEIDDLFKG